MAQYRIVKMKNLEFCYKVQEKILGLFWMDSYWNYRTLEECEWFIKDMRKTAETKRDNPRDIVIAEYN